MIILPTEPIGSIPRPPELIAAVQACATGAGDRDALARLYETAIRDTLQRFAQTGSPVITDGEQTKHQNFLTYAIDGAPQMRPGGFALRFADGHVRHLPRLVEGGFRYTNYAERFVTYARRFTDQPLKQAIVAPSAMSLCYPAEGIAGYARETFRDDLLREHLREIDGCFAAGAQSVQIDFTEARFAMKVDPSGRLLNEFIDLINAALDTLPQHRRRRIGIHICGGSDLDSSHSADVDYGWLLPLLFDLSATDFFIAVAREPDRRRVLKMIGGGINPHQRAFVGVIDPTDPRIETPEEVRDRVLEAAEYIALSQLGTTDDCGFSPFSDDLTTSRDTAFAKIRARVEGTALAGMRLTAA